MTKIAIREARLKEIRQEILNSTKLQAHLADNPKDAKVIFGFKFLSNLAQGAKYVPFLAVQ